MDIFSTQIVAAMKKIRIQKERPDGDNIFKEVVKESATKIALEDIQEALQYTVSDGKLINTPYMMMMMMMNCFCSMVDRRKALALFPVRTIVRDPHHRESPTRHGQDLNLCRT